MRRSCGRWFALLAVAVSALLPAPGYAQQPDAGVPAGRIEGRLVSGTAGFEVAAGTRVQLIALAPDGGITTLEAETNAGGAFLFEPPADPSITYIVRAIVEGVQYLSGTPVLLSAELPTSEVELQVYAATTETPNLTIDETIVTVLDMDPVLRQISFVRQDIVRNPADRTYTGGDDNITLRVPVPDGLLDADGVSEEGSFTIEGGTVTTTVPLRPGLSQIVTRYVVEYDATANAYQLRVTSPLPTDRIAIRVPESFVSALAPLADSVRGERGELQGEPLLVVESRHGEPRAGQSAAAELRGLAGRNAPNPLTGLPGAAIGLAVVLGVIAVGAHVVSLGQERLAREASG